MDQDKLVALFKTLGAPEPEGWAASQIEEGIPQLARFLFLRQAWNTVVAEDESGWIDAQIQQYLDSPNAPYAGTGRALESLRSKGATDSELIDLVRGMQVETLFELCYLLEDPGELEPEVEHVRWGLHLVDDNQDVVDSISGLHESVLETDPTGREMRPRVVPPDQ